MFRDTVLCFLFVWMELRMQSTSVVHCWWQPLLGQLGLVLSPLSHVIPLTSC
jgi:hypothetical protein